MAAISRGDPLEPDGQAAAWSPKTRLQVSKDYGRFLFWLRSQGLLDGAATPGERLTRDTLTNYVSHLTSTGMASTSLLSRMRNLRQAVQAMDPAADLTLISRLCSRLKSRAEPVRDTATRVVPTPVIVDAAVRYYDKQISGAGRMAPSACLRARDALLLLLLAHLPLRLDNFAGLRLGVHIVRLSDRYVLRLDQDEPKEGRAYETDVPAGVTVYMDHYIQQIRPCLLHGKTCDRLWVSTRGTGASASTIYYQIMRTTRRLLGHSINPHAFRAALMTTMATEAPDQVRAGARVLGHRDLRTGEAHYNFADARAAQQAYFAVLHAARALPPDADGDANAEEAV